MKQGVMRNALAAALVFGVVGYLGWSGREDGEPVTQSQTGPAPAGVQVESVSTRDSAASPGVRLDSATLHQAIADAYRADESGDDAPSIREVAQTLADHLDDTGALLAKLADAPSQQVGHLQQLLESKLVEFEVVQQAADAWLDAQPDVSATQRAALTERFTRVSGAVRGVVGAEGAAQRAIAITRAQDVLGELSPPSVERFDTPTPTFTEDTSLDIPADALPIAPPPAYFRAQAADGSAADPSRRVAGLLDALGIGAAVAAAPSSPLGEAQACGYTAADVGDALPEVDVDHADILALAGALDYSPVRIYAYVKNNIVFEPYYGSLKGAVGTLKSGSGNATDQASLLIALLRASQVPARYVKGLATFDKDDPRLLDWIGTKTVAAAEARIDSSVGASWVSGNDFSLYHVWVEACVPYDNYRGSGGDLSGHHWIPLDASFKTMRYNDGDTVPVGFSFDYTDYLSTRTHIMPQEALVDQLEAHLGRALNGLGYEGRIVPVDIDVLPSTTPYRVNNFLSWSASIPGSETAALPPEHRLQAEFELSNAADQALVPKLVLDMPKLATGRLTLAFDGATAADQAAIDAWHGSGGDWSCGSTNVNAVYRLEGADVTPAGTTQTVDICKADNKLKITVAPLGDWLAFSTTPLNEIQYQNIGAHNYHALQVYAYQASNALIAERNDALLLQVGATADPNTLQDEILGEYLHIVGLKFMNYAAEATRKIGRLHGMTGDGAQHIGLTSTAMRVEYLFDLPLAVSGDGFLVDVPGFRSRSRDITTGGSNFDSFVLGGYAASAYESYIWQEHAHLDAVSTVRGIQFANDAGISSVVLTSAAQVDSLLNQGCPESALNYSAAQKNTLRDLFTNGYHKVTLPVCQIRYDNWLGSVWASEYNVGGVFKAGYKISGGYNGGYSLGTPISNYYNATLGTGSLTQIAPTITSSLFVDTNTSSTVNISVPESGVGTGAGENVSVTTSSWDPVNLFSGNMYHKEADLRIKGRGGLDFAFERFYNSSVRKDGPLGYGWTHSLNHHLRFFDDTSDGKTNAVVWVDGTGANNQFTIATPVSGQVSPGTTFDPQPGLYVTAKREADGTYTLTEQGGVVFHFENVPGADEDLAKLTRVVDRNGNALQFSYDGQDRLVSVTDDLTRKLDFHYDDGDQHITRIVDWGDGSGARTFRYSYGNGDLVSYESPLAVANPAQQAPTTYEYYTDADGTNLDHAMKAFQYPNGYRMVFQYYTNGKTFRHTDLHGNSFTFRYNKFRRETTTVNERGIQETHLFNEYGLPVEQTRGDGSRQKYSYDDTNNPLKETSRRNPLGYVSQFTYNTDGDLTGSTLPDGSSVQYLDHNAFHQPTKVRDARGNYRLYKYDANGNLTETIVFKTGKGATATAAFDPAANAADVLAWTVSSYDAHGNLLDTKRVRDFASQNGPSVEFVYDTSGLNVDIFKRCGVQHDDAGALVEHCKSESQVHDALGRMIDGPGGSFYRTQLKFDADGRVVRTTDAINRWRDLAYDGNGNLIAQSLIGRTSGGQHGLLIHDSVEYDALDRPVVNSNLAGFKSTSVYDEGGNVIQVTDADGYTVHFEYDALSRPLRAIDAGGRAVETEYDVGGRPIRVTDPNGNSTTYSYYGPEENGRLRTLTQADGRSVEYFFDDNGNIVRTLDNTGRESLTDFDALNRPVRSVGPVHDAFGLVSIRQVTVTEYDTLGNVAAVKAGYTTDVSGSAGSDVLQTQATYSYDDFGRVIQETDALGKSTSFTYDRHGNLTRRVGANGHSVDYSYDHDRNGLLLSATARLNALDPNPLVTQFAYNDLGQVVSAVSPEVTYSYQYDTANRLVSVTDSRGSKALSYDRSPGGLLNSVADSDGRQADFLYDATGRLTALRAPNGEQVNFLFDAGGRLNETRLDNGAGSSYRYDNGDKLLQVINRTSQGIVSQHDYGYDTLGRRTSHTETVAGTTTNHVYQYDNLGRLIEVLNGTTSVETYAYDQYDNRRTRTPAGSSTLFYSHDVAHQLNAVRDGSDAGPLVASFQYDDAGNLIQSDESGTVRNLTYDALDRLVQVELPGQLTEQYRYDHENRRIGKTSAGTTEHYLYSGNSLWGEFDAAWGEALALYAYTGLDAPVMRITPNAADTRYYHQDGLGSVVAVSDAAGTTLGSSRYDAWGNVVASTGSVPHYGYTGREPDATGLIYYRARYYHPGIGRFLQRDPAGFVDGVNPYAYVGNSPVNFVDPLGLSRQAPLAGTTSNFSGTIRQFNADIQSAAGALSTDLGNAAEYTAGRALEAAANGNTLESIGLHAQGLILSFGSAAVNLFAPDVSGAADAVDEFNSGNYFGAATTAGETVFENVGLGKVYKAGKKARENGNYVYRGLAKGEDPSKGLQARSPGAGNSEISHVAGKRQSQWISTTKDMDTAINKYGENGVVRIDLNKVNSQISDVSGGFKKGGRMTNWAIRDQEVLIRDNIPADAITRIK